MIVTATAVDEYSFVLFFLPSRLRSSPSLRLVEARHGIRVSRCSQETKKQDKHQVREPEAFDC